MNVSYGERMCARACLAVGDPGGTLTDRRHAPVGPGDGELGTLRDLDEVAVAAHRGAAGRMTTVPLPAEPLRDVGVSGDAGLETLGALLVLDPALVVTHAWSARGPGLAMGLPGAVGRPFSAVAGPAAHER